MNYGGVYVGLTYLPRGPHLHASDRIVLKIRFSGMLVIMREHYLLVELNLELLENVRETSSNGICRCARLSALFTSRVACIANQIVVHVREDSKTGQSADSGFVIICRMRFEGKNKSSVVQIRSCPRMPWYSSRPKSPREVE